MPDQEEPPQLEKVARRLLELWKVGSPDEEWGDAFAELEDALPPATVHAIVCGVCGRHRDPMHHRMDSYNYNALQVVTGQPLGWYSGDDGEICPEDMTKMMRRQ